MTSGVDNQKVAIGARLKEARAVLGLTQKDLCALIDKPLPSLRDYELGKSIPGGDAIASLARAGINANWLLTGEGEMLWRPGEMTGAAIATAIRESGLSIDETVARMGCGIDELLAWLEGRQLPSNTDMARIAEVTGYALSKLQSASDLAESLAQIEVMHARVTSKMLGATEKAGMSADEATLLARYDQADEKGKALLLKVAAAVASPSLKAWFDAGLALSEAATIIDKKR